MYDPPHPGEFIRELYLEGAGLSVRRVAAAIKISPSTFTRILNGKSSVTPEMALRLAKTLGRSPKSWLALQNNYALWQTHQCFTLWESITGV